MATLPDRLHGLGRQLAVAVRGERVRHWHRAEAADLADADPGTGPGDAVAAAAADDFAASTAC